MKNLAPLFVLFLISYQLVAQKSTSIQFGAGYWKTLPGKRLISTGPGWNMDIQLGHQINKDITLGIGFLWGATPEIDAPEFEVYEPRDHPIWFESSQVYGLVRYHPYQNAKLQPFYQGRVGWTSEYSEYSGPTVDRNGILMGIGTGIQWLPLKFFSITPSINFIGAFLGRPTSNEDILTDKSSSFAAFTNAQVNLGVWF